MTTTRKKTLLHCGILTGILGAVVLLIFLVHPGCVYGAQTDWSNQHFAIKRDRLETNHFRSQK